MRLKPDPLLRRVVIGVGILSSLAGLILLLIAGLPWHWRACLAGLWVADCSRGLRARLIGYRRVAALRMDSAGHVRVTGPDATIEPARLVAGSLVLRHFAWLRLRFADGRCHAELLLAARSSAATWHALQLLWNQCRGAFGQSAPA